MSNKKTKEEVRKHSKEAIGQLNNLLETYISSNEDSTISKADKLSYWLEDYTKFLSYEPSFKPNKLKRYKRGEIIKVHLGYNIGSEEGGLHYCVVLDKENSINNPVVTVIPLTSVKNSTDINKLRPGSVYLGNSLYTAMFSKLGSLLSTHKQEIAVLKEELIKLSETLKTVGMSGQQLNDISDKINNAKNNLNKLEQEKILINKIKKESEKMNKGSIALVSQITTISKIRIYDPKTNFDILSKIKLSNENLDLIDAELKKLFLKNEF